MDVTNLNKKDKRKRKPSVDISTMVYGKIPPQARDLEDAILGIAMLQPNTFDTIAGILTPECFYVDANQRVCRAMVNLSLKQQQIEMLSVVQELREMEQLDVVGGPYYVTQLTNKVVSSANLQSFCRVVYEKYMKREQIRICGEAIAAAYEEQEDAFNSIDETVTKLSAMTITGAMSTAKKLDQLIFDRLQYYAEMSKREGDIIGVPTGYPSIDKLTYGWIPGDLIILAARPSVGKTALALNFARYAAASRVKPTPVLFFSLEMDEGKLTDRLICAETKINLDTITQAKFPDHELNQLRTSALSKLSKQPLYIEHLPSLHVMELRSKVRLLHKKHGIGLVIVDYLQLMSGRREDLSGSNREQELANISRNLKSLATELKIPIIALSQMSRDIEKGGGRSPKLSDIRESGAIEQDADVVAFLTRLDYEDDEKDPETANNALIYFKKNRQGALGTLRMKTALEVQSWMEEGEYETYQRNIQLS